MGLKKPVASPAIACPEPPSPGGPEPSVLGQQPAAGFASRAGQLWTAGARFRVRLYETGLLRQRSLRAKVISIGNISWGGTGKTPLTIWLAEQLQVAGLRVSILTRGYGRTSTEKIKVLPPGTTPESAAADGDEVRLYLRHLKLPIGISSSRFEAGRQVEENYPVDIHLLDDGFQHLALARNLDIVLIDAANPLGGRPGWPVLLREGWSALRRAHLVLLTRCEMATAAEREHPNVQELEQAVRDINPGAACFRVSTRLLHFVSLNGECTPRNVLVQKRALAFCRVGNPESFFHMVKDAGIELVASKVFPDHHQYSERELDNLRKMAEESRADCLITTEKDIVNLPPVSASSLPLFWAAIEMVIRDEDRLLRCIRERLHLFPESVTVQTKAVPGT